jgi:hypothetical protein
MILFKIFHLEEIVGALRSEMGKCGLDLSGSIWEQMAGCCE